MHAVCPLPGTRSGGGGSGGIMDLSAGTQRPLAAAPHISAGAGPGSPWRGLLSVESRPAPGPAVQCTAAYHCQWPGQSNTKCKKVGETFGRNFWRGQFPPPKVPLAPGNRVFLFWPGISLSAKGCPRPKGPGKPVFCDFPPLGVRSAKMQNVKKLRTFGEKLLGWMDFPPKKCP